MSLSHMENMPVGHSSPQGAQRPSWKQWLLYSTVTVLLLLCSFSALIFTFLPLKTAQGPCVAKFGPLPSKWQMPSPEPSCVNKTADWRLKILQNGLYLIYGQVAPNTAYKGRAPFEVQLRKNEDPIQALTNNSTIQNVGGAYEFHAGDVIDLIFNAEHQILKNKTYWGIFLLANSQFIS
ncbi:tumor necrosis factor ligand superfamily member 18 [Cervus canadensis]|uniref:tumor necrosis factor ligand superfamily member 18 n=1 Tax=Cervus canadensis TaxID=1574408 RepID=UPI001C9E8C5E|nr:tumor necrosis factor ligand superfamily member 18 [Cervus canadensis]XP_043341816.1 tumor necrosis factor ligand superfamily member 18 [Cervus canadensis]XP_043341817.1 tumor necrosis factor ligand superfamily member 18 [Cervus canadensis]XP_043341818.1 tumor necrosis factor ligand superfamily member 18 [Cervus canadensis]XP_043341819.1 tumor necrosis factor ligand superfamily member 18 [Cervus canadensis]